MSGAAGPRVFHGRSPDPVWADHALCRGTDPALFVAEAWTAPEQISAAKQMCAQCPVIQQCLAHALANHEEGMVWGGATDDERRRMRRHRKRIDRARILVGQQQLIEGIAQ